MPEICCFHGIIIRMRFREHPPPHFHVEYGGFNASVSIADLALSEGRLPGRVERLVLTWAARYQEDLLANWARTQNHERVQFTFLREGESVGDGSGARGDREWGGR